MSTFATAKRQSGERKPWHAKKHPGKSNIGSKARVRYVAKVGDVAKLKMFVR